MGWLDRIKKRLSHDWEKEVGRLEVGHEEVGRSDDSVLLQGELDLATKGSLTEWKTVITAFYSAAAKGNYNSRRDFIAFRNGRGAEWKDKWNEFIAVVEDYEQNNYAFVISAAREKAASFEGQRLVGKRKLPFQNAMWLVNNLKKEIHDMIIHVDRNVIKYGDYVNLRVVTTRVRDVDVNMPQNLQRAKEARDKVRQVEVLIRKIESCLESVYK